MWILKNVYAELVNDLTNIFDTEGYHYRQDLGCEQKPLLKSPMSPTLLPPDWRVPEKAILTVQVYSQAYYHHVLEGTLLRMFLVEALLDELKLPQSYFDSILLAGPISSYVTESLSLFGWTNQEQITINHDDDGRSVFSKEAWVPTGNGCCMPSCYQIRIAHHYINKRLKLWGRLDRKKEVIIIIRRDDSHKRRIINWKALYDATKKKFPWVQVVVFEEPFSFVDTVRLFAKAKLVIAPHGAGNANMLFARPDYARLIEIQTPWYNGYSLCYLRTSICFGHDYTSLRYDTFEVDVDDVLEHAERAWYRKSIYEKNQDL
jgi:capsular polysaccharide biosynthesis protein